MAASDAKYGPRKNVAYRVTFPIMDNDGDLVTAAAALDSEISKDGGTFADVTAEATEIATSSGIYYLDLTATEMNADTVAIIVKTTTTDAKTTTIVLYPQEDGMASGVCTTGGSTTSITTSAITPSAAVTDQFKGRIVVFDRNTTTANLRGQATDITASTAGGTLTVTALSTAPASGDTFRIY